MKANGNSASRRFSARLKCTRPTRFQAGFRVFRKPCRSVAAAARAAAAAASNLAQSASRTSGVRYSEPGIMGAVSDKTARSAEPGAATAGKAGRTGASAWVSGACRHSAVT